MTVTAQRLYELLPAIYRLRDAEAGGPLEALVRVLAEQGAIVEENIAGLYENWFIETCDEWAVPYIGDLLGVRGLHEIREDLAFSQRARVANTLGYRRRKGTATMLEQLAHDTTGWEARAVEFFEQLSTTQHYNHPRPANHRTPDLRDTDALELLDGPFGTAAHTADVRRIAVGRGRHNIPNVGLFLWRLESYHLDLTDARAVADPPDGRYWFHPLGFDSPLFNRRRTETEITELAREFNVPGPLRRRAIYDELEQRRQILAEGGTPEAVYFGADQPVLRVSADGAEIEANEILVCDLTGWHLPPASKSYEVVQGDGSTVSVPMPIGAAVDPHLGRLTLPAGVVPAEVRVSSAHAGAGDTGGGPYDRRSAIQEALDGRSVTWQIGVSRTATPVGGETIVTSLTDAVVAWNQLPAGAVGLIAVMDNATYVEDLVGIASVKIPAGSLLVIAAGDWPTVPDPAGGGGQVRRVGGFEPKERRAHLRGGLSVAGSAAAGSDSPGTLTVDGLVIEGSTTVLVGNLGALRLSHATLRESLTVKSSAVAAKRNANLEVALRHCLARAVLAPPEIGGIALADCLLDAPFTGPGRGFGVAADVAGAAGPDTSIERSTILGGVHVETLELASEVLFTEPVTAKRLQTGCVRFSYLPAASSTPRRYRCQPDLALAARAEELGLETVADLPAAERARIRRRLTPSFTSTDYGDPGYGQLRRGTAAEISTGAEDGSEMGAWSFLKQPQRTANLNNSLDEFLRFGLEAGLIEVT